MNLRDIRLWKSSTSIQEGSVTKPSPSDLKPLMPARSSSNVEGNVVPLHADGSADNAELPNGDLGAQAGPRSARFLGLLNAPELTSFFQENYFGLGRHNGSHYRSQEALNLGRNALVAKFQNCVAELIERNQTKVNKLQNELIAIEGVSTSMSAQLRLACEQAQRDMKVLQDQIDSAQEGKGWVLEALNRYQIGFTKGLREAIDFELLTR